jgi:PAS domain-containing protein
MANASTFPSFDARPAGGPRLDGLATSDADVEDAQDVRVIASLAPAIALIDRTGDIRLWNRTACRISGIDSATAIGRHLAEIVCPADGPAFCKLLGAVVAETQDATFDEVFLLGGRPTRVRVKLLHAHDDRIWLIFNQDDYRFE